MYVSKTDREINPVAAQVLDGLGFWPANAKVKLVSQSVFQHGFSLGFRCQDGKEFVMCWWNQRAKGLSESVMPTNEAQQKPKLTDFLNFYCPRCGSKCVHVDTWPHSILICTSCPYEAHLWFSHLYIKAKPAPDTWKDIAMQSGKVSVLELNKDHQRLMVHYPYAIVEGSVSVEIKEVTTTNCILVVKGKKVFPLQRGNEKAQHKEK